MAIRIHLKKIYSENLLIALLLMIGMATGWLSCQPTHKKPFSYKLRLNMTEKLVDTTRSLCIHFKSDDFKEKAGFILKNKVTIDSIDQTIHIHLMTQPSTPPSKAPLETVAALDNLKTGAYKIVVHFKDQMLPGILRINDRCYIIRLADNPFIWVNKDTLNKIPIKAIFGTVDYYSQETEPLIDDFIADLKDLGAKEHLYIPGNYHFFSINADGQIAQPSDKGYAYTKHFIFQYNGNKSALKALIKNFAFAHTTELVVNLRTYDGALYNIWSFGN